MYRHMDNRLPMKSVKNPKISQQTKSECFDKEDGIGFDESESYMSKGKKEGQAIFD